jgi:hypothetical protein
MGAVWSKKSLLPAPYQREFCWNNNFVLLFTGDDQQAAPDEGKQAGVVTRRNGATRPAKYQTAFFDVWSPFGSRNLQR